MVRMRKILALVIAALLIASIPAFAVNQQPMEQIKKQDREQTSINEVEQAQIRLELTNRLRLLNEALDHQQIMLKEQTQNQFKDIENHWAREHIMLAASWGLVNGYPDGYFRPDRPISGPEGVLMLSRIVRMTSGEFSGMGEQNQIDIERVPVWARERIMDPAALRIASQSEFYGESQLNRLMLAVMLAKSMGIEAAALPEGSFDFVDQDYIPKEYAGYIHALRLLEVIEGFEGRLDPLRTVNRAEAAAMMMRVLNMLDTAPKEVRIEDGKLIVELPENPTTGFTWSFKSEKGELIEPIENRFMSGDSGNIVGAGGIHRWVFRGLLEGESRLTFRYFRSWEGEESAIDERIYEVHIGAGGMILSAELMGE
jgi:predicted secreted protein